MKRGWVIALGALAAGCGGGSHGTDGGQDAGLDPTTACTRLGAARCALMARCYPAFLRDTPADCQTAQLSRCLDEYTPMESSFKAARAVIDSAKVDDCETRMNTSLCPPTFPPGYLNAAHPFSDCEWTGGLALGQVDAGGLCSRPIDCGAGSTCVQVNGACLGGCASLGQLHQACGTGCDPSLYCDTHGSPNPVDFTCETPQPSGATCATSAECAADLYCVGVCRPRGAQGDPCVFDSLRLSTCAPGLACDVTPFTGQTGTCILPRAKEGACQFHWSCQPGLACSFLNYAGFPQNAPPPGLCGPMEPVGTACDYSTYANYLGTECQAGAVCGADGKCDVIPQLGQNCIPSAQACAGDQVYCRPSGPTSDTGTCTGPSSVGQRCAFQIDANNTVQIPCVNSYCEAQNTFVCLAANTANGAICTQDGECTSGRCAVQQDRTMRCEPACP
jgi:hypothetical protein